MPAMLVKPLYIYPHVYTSTWSVIGPLTFSDIYTILHNVAFRCSDECFNIQDLRVKGLMTFLVNAYVVLLLSFVLSSQHFVLHFKFNFVLCIIQIRR